MAINDGSATAPAGIPQLPTLLDSYGVNRAPWQVAGVDYHVGVPDGLALKDPATISMAGVTVNTSTHIVTVTGSNVSLDGYDFSLNGGWGVVINTTNTTISNSKFLVGSNGNAPILGTQSSGNVTVANCTIDGNNSADVGGLIEMRGTGTLTVDHSWLKNSGGDMIQMHNAGPSAAVVQYNLIQNAGMAPGAHGDYTEFIGGPFTATITHNTTTQNGGATQGFMVEPDLGSSPGVITSGEIGNNTMTGSVNAFTGITVADLVNTFTVHDNYFNPSQTIGGLAFGGVRGGPDDGSSKSVYVHNVDMTSGAIVQDANAPTTTTSTSTSTSTSPSPSPAPSAPVIGSFSQDTGVVGDGITSDNTLALKGTAAAGSTVKVYDGSTQIGSTTADSSGSWNYITSVLTDAKHVLTATATNSSGTSTKSAALSVTVDTVAPSAPVEVNHSVTSTNQVVLNGTAEANSKITVYDGTTVVGTGTTSSTGSWSVTTSALATGTHGLTATATDVAGNVSALSQPMDPVIGTTTSTSGSTTTTSSSAAAPVIASFSTDSGVVGDHITNDNTLTLAGTAVANTTVKVFDGTTQVGTATANSSGQWSLTTPTLSDGSHSLTATDTDSSGHTSAASAALSVNIDTHAPSAPTLAAYSQAGAAVGGATTLTDLILKGTAEAHSTVKVFDGTTQIGSATADSSGAWSLDTGHLASGKHSFTSTDMDVAGNASTASAAKAVTVTAPIEFTNLSESHHIASIKGTADAYSQIKLYEGSTSVGTVQAGADGTWSFTSGYLSNKVHTFTAQEVNSSGQTVATSSGEAILGSTRSNTLTSTSGDDFFFGNGHPDTFVFAANFGHDVIKDFVAGGRGHDTIQFSSTEFNSFASVLSHASQVGHDVVIASGNDTLTLKNTSLTSLNSHDFHFA